MAKVRIDDDLKKQLKKFLDGSDEWSKQSEFVNQAIRELLRRERSDGLTDDQKRVLKEFIKELEE